MADVRTTVSAVTELVPAEIITTGIMQELIAKTFAPGLVRQFAVPAGLGTTIRIPKENAADAYSASVAETDTLESVEWDLQEATVTVGRVGILRELSWLAQYANVLGPEGLRAEIIDQDARKLATTIESDLLGVINDFSTAVGTTGVNMTVDDWLEAIARCRLANADLSGHVLVAVLHPQQLWDLQADASASGAGIFAAGSANGLLNGNAGGPQCAEFYGIPCYCSTLVPLSGDSADRVGAMFPAAASASDTQAPVVMATVGQVRVQYDYKLERDTDRFVVYYTYGQVNADLTRGVAIATDA